MNTQEIVRLLEKYYNGESSEEEETILKRFFEGEDIPSELETEKVLFNFYAASASDKIPLPSPGLEKRIISAIDVSDKKIITPARRQTLIMVMSAAAGLLILVGSYFILTRSIEPKDTFSDPQIAYSQAVKILYDVSSQINRGTSALDRVTKIGNTARKSFGTITKSTTVFEDNLRNLDYFQKAINMVSSPMDIGKNK
jgi:hypothetical protein